MPPGISPLSIVLAFPSSMSVPVTSFASRLTPIVKGVLLAVEKKYYVEDGQIFRCLA